MRGGSKLKKYKLFILLMVVLLVATGCQYSLPWIEDTPEPEAEVPDYEPTNTNQNNPPSSSTINQNAGIEMRPTVLYLANSTKQGLIHFPTEIPRVVGIAKSAISHLVDDVANYHLISGTAMELPLPSNTRVLGATVKDDGLCKIDLSSEILNCENTEHERVAIEAIVYTLTEFATIEQVQIMIDGEIIEELTYGTKVNQPLKRKE